MKVELPKPGTYVVAVSGGVDSMVLLDLISKLSQKNRDHKIIVAHLDHGIRTDSNLDAKLVQQFSKDNNLPFITKRINLGISASEDLARHERYKFLNDVVKQEKALWLLTAHHADDLIETAIINILRGTGRKGLTSLMDNKKVIRPLLNYSKQDILDYAHKNNIKWREDVTNQDEKYLRNYIRINIVPKLKPSVRAQLLNLIINMAGINQELDELILDLASVNTDKLDCKLFVSLPHNAAKEVLASWLRHNGIRSFKKSTLESLTVSAKIGTTGQLFPVQKKRNLRIYKDKLALV